MSDEVRAEAEETVDRLSTTAKRDRAEAEETVDRIITTAKRDRAEAEETVDRLSTTAKRDALSVCCTERTDAKTQRKRAVTVREPTNQQAPFLCTFCDWLFTSAQAIISGTVFGILRTHWQGNYSNGHPWR